MNSLEIKEGRRNLKLTQLKLAKMIGVSLKTISNYENGSSIPEHVQNLLSIVLKTVPFNPEEEQKLNIFSRKNELICLLEETEKQIEVYSKYISLLHQSYANIQQQIETLEIIENQEKTINSFKKHTNEKF